MKKFTLVFVLLVLTITFIAMYFFFLTAKKIPSKVKTNETSTESVEEEPQIIVQQGEDMGPSVYEDYSKDLYDRALDEGRIVVLFFTANWCPICREQEPVNQEVFKELDKSGVVGLRVHILDSETTDETDALAKKFDVVSQHTFVILDSKGRVFYKYTGPLEKSDVETKILDAVNSSEVVNVSASDSGEIDMR